MSDTIILLYAADLPGLSAEVRSYELLRRLSHMTTSRGKSYAVYSDPDDIPATDLCILAFSAVPPNGATKLYGKTISFGAGPLKATVNRQP